MKFKINQLFVRLITVLLLSFFSVLSVQAEEVTGKTATDLAAMMGTGWNLGNSFDADGSYSITAETSWGNPKTTQAMIDMIKEGGFNTVRIPVSWGTHTTNNGTYTYAIDQQWMNRVKEVVDYCFKNNMFVILNIHHDNDSKGDGFFPSTARKTQSITYVKEIWTQIAATFANYDQHLIFETLNEPRLIGDQSEWSVTGKSDAVDIINVLNQTAVDAIRADGNGYNEERVIMCPGYAASLEGCNISTFKLPTDIVTADNRIAVSLHAYTPSNFCLAGSATTFTGAGDIGYVFNTINNKFLSKGIAVIIGETSASYKNNEAERLKWVDCYYGYAKQYKVPVVLWDNGTATDDNKGEAHGFLNRKTVTWNYKEFVDKIMEVLEIDGSGEQVVINPTIAAAKTDGITLTISCSREMTASTDFSGFILFVNGVEKAGIIKSMSVFDKNITFTLDASLNLNADDIVNVSYNGDYLKSTKDGVLVVVNKMSVENQVSGGNTILADCENPDDPSAAGFSGGWYSYKDENTHASYEIENEGANGTSHAAHFTFTNVLQYSGMGFSLNSGDSPADFTGATGISFYYKGAASVLEIGTEIVGDYSYHIYTVPACNVWTKIEFTWSEVESQDWGIGGALNFAGEKLYSQVTKIQWKETSGSGELWVDEVMLIGREMVKSVDRIALNEVIFEANQLANSVDADNYFPDALTNLQTAIDQAAIIAMMPSATQTQIDEATTTLNAAVSTFNASKYADKTPLATAISRAQKVSDAAVVGEDNGKYTQEDKDIFDAAIAVAQTQYDIAGLSESQMNAAIDELDAAVTAFNASVINIVDKEALKDLIDAATDILATTTAGTQVGQYSQTKRQALQTSLATAQTRYDSPTISQSAVDFALSGLREKYNLYMASVVTATAIDDVAIVLQVYPNPCTEYVVVEASQEIAYVSIIDMQGAKIIVEIGANAQPIEVATLQAGVYTMHIVFADGTTKTTRFVKK